MPAKASDPLANTKVQELQGGDALIFASGSQLVLEPGATLYIGGTDVTAGAGGSNVAGVAGGYKIARGQMTTASASDTVVTGLTTVISATANMEDAPVIGADRANAIVGDQAGTPAAGSILIKSYKPTATGDATPIAATTFSKKVNWIALGT